MGRLRGPRSEPGTRRVRGKRGRKVLEGAFRRRQATARSPNAVQSLGIVKNALCLADVAPDGELDFERNLT